MQPLTKVIKLRVYAGVEQAALLRTVSEQYRQACNYVSRYIFEHGFPLNSLTLNKLLYSDVRGLFHLKSQLAQSVSRTVVARYKTVKEQMERQPWRYTDDGGNRWLVPKSLEWLWRPIEFHRPQADLVRDRDYSFVKGGELLSLNTLGKRINVAYVKNHFAEYFDGSWSFGTGKLVELKGKWYLHIPVTRETGEFSQDTVKHVVGIDRGLRFLATTYDEQGKTTFVSGKAVAAKRRKFLQVRQQLQSKGTKSAKRALRRVSGRENRWISDVNHRISKTLVRKYGANTLFVLEDLSGVSFERQGRYDLASWIFFQLEQFLSYKAHEVDSEVLKVSAKYTSQRCPKCGSIRKSNRNHDLHRYDCQCGYKSNDDRVGAMNIQQLGTQWISGDDHPHFEKLTAA